jgi:hypothetical protein
MASAGEQGDGNIDANGGVVCFGGGAEQVVKYVTAFRPAPVFAITGLQGHDRQMVGRGRNQIGLAAFNGCRAASTSRLPPPPCVLIARIHVVNDSERSPGSDRQCPERPDRSTDESHLASLSVFSAASSSATALSYRLRLRFIQPRSIA